MPLIRFFSKIYYFISKLDKKSKYSTKYWTLLKNSIIIKIRRFIVIILASNGFQDEEKYEDLLKLVRNKKVFICYNALVLEE